MAIFSEKQKKNTRAFFMDIHNWRSISFSEKNCFKKYKQLGRKVT